jgi:hypothetical protein
MAQPLLITEMVMRTTVISSVFLATISAINALASASEPMELFMWGGGLIVLSLVLRPRDLAAGLGSTEQIHRAHPLTRPAEG